MSLNVGQIHYTLYGAVKKLQQIVEEQSNMLTQL